MLPNPQNQSSVKDEDIEDHGTQIHVPAGKDNTTEPHNIPLSLQKRKRRIWHWHEPGTSQAEKWLIFKLDIFILSYTCLTFFVKYLDQTNITNAYVSGMKEDLNLVGNELNWLTTYFNIGIIIGSPFATPVLTVIQPRYWLPFCTTVWALLVLFMYKAESVTTLYILRFFVGVFESGAMPGAFFIIGSWYRRSEVARRTTLFWFSSVAGQMISGYIQAGLYHNMDGRAGLSAWRWLFILDFIITIPVVILGVTCCPDQPGSKKIWWMSEEERELCAKRISTEGRAADEGKWTFAVWKCLLSSWQIYAFCLAWGIMQLTCGVNLQRWITLYVKSLKVDGKPKYSVEKVNAMPTVVGCTAFAWMVIAAFLADTYGYINLVIFGLGAVQLFGYSVLLAWPQNESFILAAYYVTSAYSGIAPLISAWMNISCAGNTKVRAVCNGLMIAIGYALETVAQQEMFPVSQAPRFKETHGYVFGVAWIVALMLWCAMGIPLMERYCKHRGRSQTE